MALYLFCSLIALNLIYVSSYSPQCVEGDCSSISALPNTSQLITKTIQPCTQVTGSKIKRFSTVVWTVNNNYTSCTDTTKRNSVLRVRTQSHASVGADRQPIIFVARGDGNVQTWKLPQYQPIFRHHFYDFTRTVCSTTFRDNNTLEDEVAMYIDTFTSRKDEVEYNISIDTVDDFTLKLNEEKPFTVAANAPQLFYFKFPPGQSSVLVTATSTDKNSCTIVSIQNATCPVNDVLDSECSKGVYQTMTTDASLTVNAYDTIDKDDFFIVIVVADISLCTDKDKRTSSSISSTDDNFTHQSIKLKIVPLKSAKEHPVAIILPVLVFLFVGGVIMATFICPCLHCTCRPFVWSRDCCQTRADEDDPSEVPLAVSVNVDNISTGASDKDEMAPLLESNKPQELLEESGIDRSLLDKCEKSIKLSDMLKRPVPTLESKYSDYGWNTITVGIFYALPAFQLVLAEQLILNTSGNQDTCFYNFKCSHPLGVLSSFNSIWSNIGYVIFGMFFIIIVGIKHYRYKHFCQENIACLSSCNCCQNTGYINPNNGLPQFFGLYYAMGIALVMEGFMSSFYHICPSTSNFQFDTAFMYIIGGLLIIKIFQARHPDVHANAFVAFFSFAVVIFLTLIGIYNDATYYWPVRVTLFLLVITSVTLFCVSFYFYHDWRLGYFIECRYTCSKIMNWFKSWFIPCTEKRDWASLKPRHLVRFLKMVATVSSNFIIGLIMIFSKKGVATVVLALFVTNFLMFTAIYLLSKFWYKEPWTVKPMIYLGTLGLSWVVAFYFYFNNVAQWEETPAVSREYNKDCIALDFYDNHDIWHFLSSVALFFSFLFVLTLDDGLNRKRRDTIDVF